MHTITFFCFTTHNLWRKEKNKQNISSRWGNQAPNKKKKTWWEHSHHTSKKIFSLYLFLSFIFVSLLWSFAHKDKSTASSSSFLLLAPLSYSPVSPSQIIASLMASSWENLRPRFLLFRSLLLFLLLLIWSCLVCQKRPTKKSTTLLFFFSMAVYIRVFHICLYMSRDSI